MTPNSGQHKSLKLFGERNSGTTYLEALIARNLDVPMLRGVVSEAWLKDNDLTENALDLFFMLTGADNLGWKHAMAPSAADLAADHHGAVVFVTLTKNPYAWLLSLYRRPNHRGGNGSRSLWPLLHSSWADTDRPPFDAFVSTAWPAVGRDRISGDFRDPVDIWNRKNRSYLDLATRAPCLNLRYEDLIRDPRAAIERLAATFDLRRSDRYFENVDSSLQGAPGQSFADYRAHYLNEAWRETLDDRHLRLINDRLDHAVMTRFGYDLLDPAPSVKATFL